MSATESILALIHEAGREGYSVPFARRRARQDEIERLQREAAEAFGAARGWRLAATQFSATVLAARRVRGRYCTYSLEFLDHPFYYRTPDRRAAAIAAHLYNLNENAISAWAAENGLRASFPAEQSWWYPGWARLVLYEPLIAPRDRGAR